MAWAIPIQRSESTYQRCATIGTSTWGARISRKSADAFRRAARVQPSALPHLARNDKSPLGAVMAAEGAFCVCAQTTGRPCNTSTGATRRSCEASSTVPASHWPTSASSIGITLRLSCLSAGSFGSGLFMLLSGCASALIVSILSLSCTSLEWGRCSDWKVLHYIRLPVTFFFKIRACCIFPSHRTVRPGHWP